MNGVSAFNAHQGMFEINEIYDLAFVKYDPATLWTHKASNTDLDVEAIIYQALSTCTDITRETKLTIKEIEPGIRLFQPGLDPIKHYLWNDENGKFSISAEMLGIALSIFACQQLSYSSQWSLFYERQEKVLRAYSDGHAQRGVLNSFAWM